MNVNSLLLVILCAVAPMLADPVVISDGELWQDCCLKPLVWEKVIEKANILKQKLRKEKRFSNVVSAAQLISLASIACWVFCVWPAPGQTSGSKNTNTVELPNDQKGFFLKTITNGVLGAIGLISVNFFMKVFDKLGGLAQTGGIALASSVGITCDKVVHKVEKYLEIVTDLSESVLTSAQEYQTSNEEQKIKYLRIMQTNMTVLLSSIEIMLARMVLEVEVIRKESRYLGRAAANMVQEIFETTNQSIEIVLMRLEKRQDILDVLGHWSAEIKKRGKSFKQFAGMTDSHEQNR